MEQFKFKEDWERHRNILINDVSRDQLRRMKSCAGCPFDTLKSRLTELEDAIEAFEKCFPKPKYSRDELLIEIARRLFIEL